MSVAEQESRFTQLVIAVIEESVTAEELSEFRSLLREHPEFKLQYLEQMRIHGLMHYRQSAAGADSFRKGRLSRLGRAWSVLARVAAVFAVVLAGVFLLRLAETRFLSPFTKSGAAVIAPVQAVRLSRTVGLILPASLPGDLKLDSGEATVRLESGVELTVLGPARLEVLDSMEVRLADGRLLAEVPPRATGFTVNAPGVSVWDLGTIFSAATRNGTSDIFVFKGKVQAMDGEGDAVGLLEEGEGVRAMPESTPQRFAAEGAGAEARELLENVRRKSAVASPVDALYAAGRIGDLWMARYLPTIVSQATPGRNTAGTRRAVPGSSVWFRPVENYSWGSGRNWMAGGALSRVPNKGEVVTLNSSRISTEAKAALHLGEKVDARCREFWMNDLGVSNNVHVRVDGGTLTCASLASVGTSGPGLLTLAKGAFSVPLLKVGENEGGAGVVSNELAALSVGKQLIVGRFPGSAGRLVLRGGKMRVGDQLIIGHNGQGLFEAAASFSARRFVVGCMSKGSGVARIEAGATGTVERACFVGGRDYSPDDRGSGTLVLRGGTLKLPREADQYALQIRYAEACRGVLIGWGSVLATFTGDNSIRMVNNGCVIADGEGANRDLDLHSLASVTNSIPNGPDGTNGWYAVNRGRVLYPRTWILEPNATRNLGEWPSKDELGLVNSVRVTFAGATPRSFLRGGLCAPDRTDLPEALPAGRPAGVWQLGLYRNNTTDEKVYFETAAVTFRYDHKHVKASDVLTLYRYENGAWKEVGRGLPDGTGCLSAAAPVARTSDGDYNIGWFALVASDQAGLTITIR